MWGDTIDIGLFFEKQAATLGDQEPILDEGGPLALRTLGLTKEQAERVVKRMMLVNFGSS